MSGGTVKSQIYWSQEAYEFDDQAPEVAREVPGSGHKFVSRRSNGHSKELLENVMPAGLEVGRDH
jgi:hypothetical protein